MLAKSIGGIGGVCNWTKTGNNVWYSAGDIIAGDSSSQPRGLTTVAQLWQGPPYPKRLFTRDYQAMFERLINNTNYGDLDYNTKRSAATIHAYSNYSLTDYSITNIGLDVRCWLGTDGTPVRSGSHGIMSVVHVMNADPDVWFSGTQGNEYTPYMSQLLGDSYGRYWLTDEAVHGPVSVQANLLQGCCTLINNYNAAAVGYGSYGGVILTQPETQTRSGYQTYPIDIGFAITGFSGFYNKSVDTNGFNIGLQVGGWSSMWQAVGQKSSRIGTCIKLLDFVDYGLHIAGRKSGATGPSINVASGAGRAKFLDGIVLGAFGDSAEAGGLRYTIDGFHGYHNGVWSPLGGGGVDGGLFTDTYTISGVDGGAFI